MLTCLLSRLTSFPFHPPLPSPSLPSLLRYLLAKEQGYRSRAAFKLIQLNQKYNFLSSTKAVLDLGAAPGGWLQVCVKYMPVSSLILGVDLVPIKHMRGVTTIQADITTPECRTLIKKELQGWDVDLVLHDGAPNVAGGQVWSKDAYVQNELVVHSLRLATHFMRPHGTFITKVFRSQDYNALLWVFQQLFAQVDVTKPMASRNASAEIFVVCRDFLAPKTIDAQILDPAHLFQQFDVGVRPVDVFKEVGKKGVRSRQGYADNEMNGLIGIRCDVMTFIEAEDPIVTLGSYHSFTFDSDAAKALLNNTSTTAEVRSLCQDLKVLGKGDFKALLRWRKRMRDWLKDLQTDSKPLSEDADAPVEKVEEKTEEEKAEEEEATMTQALRDLKSRQLHRSKVEKRKKHTRKQKAVQRLMLNANNLTEVQEMIGADPNDELFSIGKVTGHALEILEGKAGEEVDDDEEEEEGEGEERDGEREEEEGQGEDSGDEDAYLASLERNLESMFDQYKERRKMVERIKEKGEEEIRQAEAAEAKAAASNADEEEEEQDDSDEEMYQQMKVGMKRKRGVDEDDEGDAVNPLVVSLEEQERLSAAKRAERWFQRDAFSQISALIPPEANNSKRKQTSRRMADFAPQVDTESSDDDTEDSEEEDENSRWLGDDEDEAPLTRREREEKRKAEAPVRDRPLPGLQALGKTREAVEAEMKKKERRMKKNVREERRLQRKAERETAPPSSASPLPSTSTSSSFSAMLDDDAHLLVDADSAKKAKRMAKRSNKAAGLTAPTVSDFEEVPATVDISSDDDAVATTLALGTRMLQKKAREAMYDSSYNRYAVDWAEQRALPEWFQAEEAMHATAQLPVTKAEVSVFKDRLKAINARPIKKIAEARQRKKAKTEARWEKIQKKMDDVSKEEGGSVGDKMRKMESLMRKKDKRSIRGDRKYFVTKKGGGIDEVRRKKGSKAVGGLTVQVDKRLKKDKRGAKVAAKKGKKRAATANKRKRGT